MYFSRRTNHSNFFSSVLFYYLSAVSYCSFAPAQEPTILAGVAKVDITNHDAGPVHDPLYVKALVIKDRTKKSVIITIDAVAIAEIGSIKNNFLSRVKNGIKTQAGILPEHVLINASHCHGIVCNDIEERTLRAVKLASESLKPVRVGFGRGYEDKISENRRIKLKNGRESDVRHAYSMPFDDEVAEVGPIDPEIGILRIDLTDGSPLAIIYNFAVHPIQGVPGGSNTADLSGFASQAIEESLGNGAIALFLQGCAGDINPVRYKDVHAPRDAEPLGNKLGLSVLKVLPSIKTSEISEFQMIHDRLKLPRSNLSPLIDQQEAEVKRLTHELKGTTLNLKTFMQLYSKYKFTPDFPSADAPAYMNQKLLNQQDLEFMDKENLKNISHYIENIRIMETITRVQTNLSLLKMHQAQNQLADFQAIDVELVGFQIGSFTLITFPGELTVRIGLEIKRKSPLPNTFIAGYTNGYIYYAPTEDQLENAGWAQEDSDCILAPGWLALFEKKAMEMLDLINQKSSSHSQKVR